MLESAPVCLLRLRSESGRRTAFSPHTMGTAPRGSTLVAVVTVTSLALSQAFTCAIRGPLRAATMTNKMSSSGRLNAGRRARPGTLFMSEMAEDYPSDTGDDRFSAGGELVKK